MIKNKFIPPVMFSLFGIGSFLLLIGSKFSNSLGDYGTGFIEGLAIVFLVIRVAYLTVCALKKKNPLKYS